MIVTRETMAELIVRDFAVKYLGLEHPFDLMDVLDKTYEIMVTKISDDEFYTLADVRYCMRVLKLFNPFSHVKAAEFKDLDTKELITYKQDNDRVLSLFLYDVINSLPNDHNKNIIKCKKCGQLFCPDHGNRKICYHCSGFNK